MQKRQRNLPKKRDSPAKLLFYLSNLLLFSPSRCRLHRRCLSSVKSNKGNEDSASRVRERERYRVSRKKEPSNFLTENIHLIAITLS